MTRLSEIIASFVKKGSRSTTEPRHPVSTSRLSSPGGAFHAREPEDSQISRVAAPQKESPEPIVTEEFRKAFKLVESGAQFVFLTGRAGTGKSTFIQLLTKQLKSYALVAPTGIAALHIRGQTIHSFFRIAPGPIDFEKIKRVQNRIGYQALKTLIIDEISMVRADLLDAVDKMLRLNASDPELPFGGVQVIAVGDLFQLPPVVTTEEEQAFLHGAYKSPFFFSASCLKRLPIRCVEFSRVFRQEDANFITILNNVREGKQLPQTLAAINERVSHSASDIVGGLILTGDNNQAALINAQKLQVLDSKTVTYTGTVTGEFRVDKQKLPAPVELSLKKGSQVMFVKNDGLRRWVNGTIGTVTELADKHVMVEISDPFGVREVRAEPETWENVKFVYDPEENRLKSERVGAFEQIPLTLAWAVTIHKSQGKTFDQVHIDLSRGAFAEGQVYVALSRCRTLQGITLHKAIEAKDIQLNYDVIQFCREIQDQSLEGP